MSKPIIVSGEAPETDSEEDVFTVRKPIEMTASIQGAVITGEDSESETENDGSICSAVSALNQMDYIEAARTESTSKDDSLLHQKLREDNKKLATDIEAYCQGIIDDASKTLNAVDQKLIRTQVTLQNAVTSLKSLSSNSIILKNKLQSLLTANFLPNINTEK